MKHVYIDSRLRSLALAAKRITPKNWIFSQGRPWLLLTPARLSRLAAILGLADPRVDDLVTAVRRHSRKPSRFCRPLGLDADDPAPDGLHPLAICPVCDGVHRPHPLDAELACAECREREERRRRFEPTPGMRADRAADARMRDFIRSNYPDAFDEGVLSPNWKYNHHRRLHRDWDLAINRILTGGAYRRVARDFECSVGLLHKKVSANATLREIAPWESN